MARGEGRREEGGGGRKRGEMRRAERRSEEKRRRTRGEERRGEEREEEREDSRKRSSSLTAALLLSPGGWRLASPKKYDDPVEPDPCIVKAEAWLEQVRATDDGTALMHGSAVSIHAAASSVLS